MSRIGKLPVALDKTVKTNITGDKIKVEGPKGKLEHCETMRELFPALLKLASK